MQLANRHMEIFSVSLVIRESQWDTTRMIKISKFEYIKWCKRVGLESSSTAAGFYKEYNHFAKKIFGSIVKS